jgi:hypothetical protein
MHEALAASTVSRLHPQIGADVDAVGVDPVGPEVSGRARRFDAATGARPAGFNVLVSLGVVVDTFETACTWIASRRCTPR